MFSKCQSENEDEEHNAPICYTPGDANNVLVEANSSNGIKVTESSAEVDLLSLVDHTIARIMKGSPTAFESLSENCKNNSGIKAIYKWGCNGSSDSEMRYFNDIFTVCIVPLQIQCQSKILWKNNCPSSTRFCRPIKLIFQKETTELIKKEVEDVQRYIENIQPSTINGIKVDHEFHLTMIEGKVFNDGAKSSSQDCEICGATSKVMNDLNLMRLKPAKEHLYEYGLSLIDAWIHCFECIIQIAYRLPIKKWQVGEVDKDIVTARQTKIQNELREEIYQLVDIPMVGSGNTNEITARMFFNQPSLLSKITGVDFELINRLSVIFRTMACSYAVNTEAFKIYAWKTAEIFVTAYPWFNMPPIIHKILIHGADIITNVSLPIGMISEEALEAQEKILEEQNQDVRSYRLNPIQLRQLTMKHLFEELLVFSDPLISSISKGTSIYATQKIKFDVEVRQLLLSPNELPSDSDSE